MVRLNSVGKKNEAFYLNQILIRTFYQIIIHLNVLKHGVTVFFLNGNNITAEMTVDLINNYNNSPLFCIQIIALYNSNKYINKSPFDIQSRIRKNISANSVTKIMHGNNRNIFRTETKNFSLTINFYVI